MSSATRIIEDQGEGEINERGRRPGWDTCPQPAPCRYMGRFGGYGWCDSCSEGVQLFCNGALDCRPCFS